MKRYLLQGVLFFISICAFGQFKEPKIVEYTKIGNFGYGAEMTPFGKKGVLVTNCTPKRGIGRVYSFQWLDVNLKKTKQIDDAFIYDPKYDCFEIMENEDKRIFYVYKRNEERLHISEITSVSLRLKKSVYDIPLELEKREYVSSIDQYHGDKIAFLIRKKHSKKNRKIIFNFKTKKLEKNYVFENKVKIRHLIEDGKDFYMYQYKNNSQNYTLLCLDKNGEIIKETDFSLAKNQTLRTVVLKKVTNGYVLTGTYYYTMYRSYCEQLVREDGTFFIKLSQDYKMETFHYYDFMKMNGFVNIISNEDGTKNDKNYQIKHFPLMENSDGTFTLLNIFVRGLCATHTSSSGSYVKKYQYVPMHNTVMHFTKEGKLITSNSSKLTLEGKLIEEAWKRYFHLISSDEKFMFLYTIGEHGIEKIILDKKTGQTISTKLIQNYYTNSLGEKQYCPTVINRLNYYPNVMKESHYWYDDYFVLLLMTYEKTDSGLKTIYNVYKLKFEKESTTLIKKDY